MSNLTSTTPSNAGQQSSVARRQQTTFYSEAVLAEKQLREVQNENLALKMEISHLKMEILHLKNLLATRNLPESQSPAAAIVSDNTFIIPTQFTSTHPTVVSEETIVPSSQETIVFFNNNRDKLLRRRSATTTATAEVVAEGSASMI